MLLKNILAIIFLVVFCSHQVHAKGKRDLTVLNANGGHEDVFQPIMLSTSILVDDDDDKPQEPVFTDVKYKEILPYNGIEDRVKRLTQGVSESIPPEFDHYGHEIRKYMARTGNFKIYSDEEFLKEQIKSVKKARVVMEYWEKYVKQEIDEIDAQINGKFVTSATKTAHKQNKARLKTFMVVLKSWIDSNERLLMYLFNNPGIVEIEYPELIVQPRNRVGLYNLLAFKQQKLKELKQFQPFEMMVY